MFRKYNNTMGLNKEQIGVLSAYLSDMSKILFASTVLGFFVPSIAGSVSLLTFGVGSAIALLCLLVSIDVMR